MKWLFMKIAKSVFQGMREAQTGPARPGPAGQIDALGAVRRDLQKLNDQFKGLRRAVWLVLILQVALLLYESLSR